MQGRAVIQLLQAAGWQLVRVTGSHPHFRRPEKRGTVTVPHPIKDISPGTLRSIERESGEGLRRHQGGARYHPDIVERAVLFG